MKEETTTTTTRKPASRSARKALSWPARQIAVNSGEDGSIIVGKILKKDQYSYGFDAQKGEYVNLVTKGTSTQPRLCGQRCRMQRQSPGF